MTDTEWHDYFAGWKQRMGWSTNKIAHVIERSRQSVSAWVHRKAAPQNAAATQVVCQAIEGYFTDEKYRAFVDNTPAILAAMPWPKRILMWAARADAYVDRPRGRPRKAA